jgi:hypothetical protein
MHTGVRKSSRLLKTFLIGFLLAATLGGCEELGMGESKEYNVYFLPNGQETAAVYVGRTTGIRSCRQLANMRRQQMKKIRADKDYICCMITKESDCAERRY